MFSTIVGFLTAWALSTQQRAILLVLTISTQVIPSCLKKRLWGITVFRSSIETGLARPKQSCGFTMSDVGHLGQQRIWKLSLLLTSSSRRFGVLAKKIHDSLMMDGC